MNIKSCMIHISQVSSCAERACMHACMCVCVFVFVCVLVNRDSRWLLPLYAYTMCQRACVVCACALCVCAFVCGGGYAEESARNRETAHADACQYENMYTHLYLHILLCIYIIHGYVHTNKHTHTLFYYR